MTDRDDDLMRGRASRPAEPAPPRAPSAPPTPQEYRARQRARATVMAVLLGAFVVLVFAITLVKIRAGMGR